MANKKIIVTPVQSLKITNLLRSDKGDTPLQQFIETIAKEGEVEEWVAEKFAASWRWNHRTDGDPMAEPKPESYYVQSELPRKLNTSNDPANGNGKVAQIIALAEQGKSTAEIIEMGYNKSTVYRQYSEWKKRKATVKKPETV